MAIFYFNINPLLSILLRTELKQTLFDPTLPQHALVRFLFKTGFQCITNRALLIDGIIAGEGEYLGEPDIYIHSYI